MNLYRANVLPYLRNDPQKVSTDAPTTLIVATKDNYVTEFLLEDIENIAPNLKRRKVRARHWFPRAKPQLFAEVVREHIARVDPAPASNLTEASTQAGLANEVD